MSEKRNSHPVLGRLFKERLQGVPRYRSKGHGCRAVRRAVGRTPKSAKPWKGLGSGVYELVEDHRSDTFRTVYTVSIGDAVHMLHAFQKSPSPASPRRSRT